MKIRPFIPAVVIAAAGLALAALAQPASLSQGEVDAIVIKFQTAYADTFDRRDAKGMAALFTENATLQNEWGDVVQGRTKIEAVLTRLMSALPADVKLQDKPIASRAVSPGVIVTQGTSQRLTTDAAPAQMFFTRVLVRHGGQWQLAATQIARPSNLPKPGSAPK